MLDKRSYKQSMKIEDEYSSIYRAEMKWFESKKVEQEQQTPITIHDLTPDDQRRVLAHKLEGKDDPLRYFFRLNGKVVNLWDIIRDIYNADDARSENLDGL